MDGEGVSSPFVPLFETDVVLLLLLVGHVGEHAHLDCRYLGGLFEEEVFGSGGGGEVGC
jgi:hypothetical protein